MSPSKLMRCVINRVLPTKSDDMAPFPYLPLMAITISLVSAMVVQMSVFVYAGFMVEYLGVVDDRDKAGYYAGALTSAYMVGRVCSSHAWGMVADRCGRRFVMVFGILSNVILSVVFGCSPTFTVAFVSRFLLGLSNGVMVVSRTLVSEVCTTKNHETIGMGFVTSSLTVGNVLGPGLGGLMANPVIHHPNFFSQSGIFGRFPFLLPNLVGAGLSLLALPLVIVFIKGAKETPSTASKYPAAKPWCLCWWYSGRGRCDGKNDVNNELADANHDSPSKAELALPTKDDLARQQSLMEPEALEAQGIRKPSWMQPESMHSTNNGPSQDGERPGDYKKDPKIESLLAQRHIRVLMFTNAMFAFTYAGFDQVLPLWALSSAAKGGLGWSSPQIGTLFFMGGLIVLFYETFLGVPYVTPWLGVKTSQRLASIFEVPVYLAYPLLSHVSGDGNLQLVLLAILLVTIDACVSSYLLCLNLTINNAVGKSRRAEPNGISVAIESMATSIAPTACSALFAFSINSNNPPPFDYHFVFYLLAAMRLAAALPGWNKIVDNGNME